MHLYVAVDFGVYELQRYLVTLKAPSLDLTYSKYAAQGDGENLKTVIDNFCGFVTKISLKLDTYCDALDS